MKFFLFWWSSDRNWNYRENVGISTLHRKTGYHLFREKTQVCGILANKEKFDEVPDNVFHESSRINSTFGGNFIDMLRFQLVMEVIEKENLVENARVMGDYLLEGLKALPKNILKN